MKLMMLKQSSSRNQRSKGSKLKLALQICLLLVICLWLLYQAKQFNNRKVALVESSKVATEERKNGYPMLKIGRKNLDPRLDELAAEFRKHRDDALKFKDEVNKLQDEEDESAGGNGDISVSNQEKTEDGEHEQLEDLIDEDDKEE